MVSTGTEKQYRSCYYLESGITCQSHGLVFCCDRQAPAVVPPMADASMMVDAFLRIRDEVIHANQGASPPCAGCPLFQNFGETDKQIKWLNFGIHTYCQFACVYCDRTQNRPTSVPYNELAVAYELKRRGLLSPDLHVAYAAGEITIHPKRNEYFDFIEENANSVDFSSNAGKFDKRLADILSIKAQNSMMTSIDCGTAEAFRQIRGVDMFDQVVRNLEEYRKYSSSIVLKYILLDENCGEADLLGFIQLCKKLNISQMIISGDLRKTWDYKRPLDYEEHIVNAAIKLAEGAIENNISFSFSDCLGQGNLKEIYHRLACKPVVISAENELDQVLSASQVVCYGAGGAFETVLNLMKGLGLQKPDVIWDIKASNYTASSNISSGHLICYPDFDRLNEDSDVGIFITIRNIGVNHELVNMMHSRGFKNVLTYDRLMLALMAKREQNRSKI